MAALERMTQRPCGMFDDEGNWRPALHLGTFDFPWFRKPTYMKASLGDRIIEITIDNHQAKKKFDAYYETICAIESDRVRNLSKSFQSEGVSKRLVRFSGRDNPQTFVDDSPE